MKELRGKVAVVTGAASGIGLAMAERFAGEGMKVVLADIERSALDAAVTRLKEGGAEVLGLPIDVSKSDEVERLRDETLAKFGKVHIVCNNAGVSRGGNIWEMSLEDWQWVLGVNLWGVIHGVRTFVPVMLDQNEEAHVINTASIAGLISPPGIGIYNTSKHAVVAISETLHVELMLRGSKVKVSVVCPGWVRTQIADSERNRPADLMPKGPRERTPQEEAVEQMTRQVIATGMEPSEVADKVLEAVREERLYVLTHPKMKKAVRMTMDNVLADKTPGMEIIQALVPGGPQK